VAQPEPNLDVVGVVQILPDGKRIGIVATMQLVAIDEATQVVVRVEAVGAHEPYGNARGDTMQSQAAPKMRVATDQSH
jgi:hypothetical protein